MITTGSKFFVGVGVFGLVAAIVYGFDTTTSCFGIVVLPTLGVAALFLGGMCLAFRDSNVATAAYPDGLPEGASTIGRGPLVSASVFPAIGAFGAVLLVLGMVFDRWMVWAGAAVLVAAVVEWTVQSWSDRASDDGEYNAALRRSLMQPFEFPVLGLLAAGLVVFGFSRVMLSLTKTPPSGSSSVVAGRDRRGRRHRRGQAHRRRGDHRRPDGRGHHRAHRGRDRRRPRRARRAAQPRRGQGRRRTPPVANTANIVARFHLTADGLDAGRDHPAPVDAGRTSRSPTGRGVPPLVVEAGR